jgi:hypothetical protein
VSLESDLVAALEADTALRALVGRRIYPLRLPQKPTLPAVVYRRIDTPTDYSHDGPGPSQPRFQFDCWAETLAAGIAVAAALRTALATLNSVGTRNVMISDELDLSEPDTGYYRREVDALIWHQ